MPCKKQQCAENNTRSGDHNLSKVFFHFLQVLCLHSLLFLLGRWNWPPAVLNYILLLFVGMFPGRRHILFEHFGGRSDLCLPADHLLSCCCLGLIVI